MDINIKGKDITLRYTMRALMMFEQVKGEMFSLKTLTDQFLLFYCMLVCSTKENIQLSFEEFTDLLDDDPTLYMKFGQFMEEEATHRQLFPEKKESEGDSKKKV